MEKRSGKKELDTHKCCVGALYYSQALLDRRMPPICAGIRQIHKASEDLEKLQTEAANLADFKFDEKRIVEQPDHEGPAEGEIELPYCEGLEIISSRQLQRGPVLLKEGIEAPTGTSSEDAQTPSHRKGRERGQEPADFVPDSERFDWTKFPERFQRISELIVFKMQQNAAQLVVSAKKFLDQIVKD